MKNYYTENDVLNEKVYTENGKLYQKLMRVTVRNTVFHPYIDLVFSFNIK